MGIFKGKRIFSTLAGEAQGDRGGTPPRFCSAAFANGFCRTLEYRQSRGFDELDPLASVGKAKSRQKIKVSMQEGGDFLRVSAKNTTWSLTPS